MADCANSAGHTSTSCPPVCGRQHTSERTRQAAWKARQPSNTKVRLAEAEPMGPPDSQKVRRQLCMAPRAALEGGHETGAFESAGQNSPGCF